MGDLGDFAARVGCPSVIGADEIASFHFTGCQLQLPMRAAVFQGVQLSVVAAIECDRAVPEFALDYVAGFHGMIIFGCIPVIRMQSGRTNFLPRIACLSEGRWLPC